MVTGRKPSRPEFQDLRWGRSERRPSPSGIEDTDYARIEARLLAHNPEVPVYHRMDLGQMMQQASAGQVVMRALLDNLPPGAIVNMDEVDLTGVAPQDLIEYSRRMSEWLERHSKEGSDARTSSIRPTPADQQG